MFSFYLRELTGKGTNESVESVVVVAEVEV